VSRRILIAAALAALAAVLAFALPAGSQEGTQAPQPGTRAVLFVANNWDGTADIVDPHTFKVLDRLNVVPDLQERMAEIQSDPVRLGYFLAIRTLIGEGHDQFADDMFSSHDGRFVYISRPSLADVVGIDLQTNKIVWRFPMEGQRADHMAISPDGRRLLVSDSTANKVHELDTATGQKVGEFPSGDSPHESNYSRDGSRIFHASIGLVYTPADHPVFDSTKGERYFQVVEAGTNKVLKRLDIGQLVRDAGLGDYSSAVRPMAISPDEKTAYLQLSFLHGFLVFDLVNDKPVRIVDLPKVTTEPRENYLLDSAHHGLSINPDGTKLCVAGTMDGYAAIVRTSDFSFTRIDGVDKPYWSTNSGDGKYCFVSVSGADKVIVIDYASEQKVVEIPVGDHPQRMRMGVIRSGYVDGAAPPAARSPHGFARLRLQRAHVSRGVLRVRARINRKATGRTRITYRAGATRRTFKARIRDGRITLRKRVARGLGMVSLSYAGNAAVAGDRVAVRVGTRPAKLKRTRASIDAQGRLTVAGSITRRARGFVQLRASYVGDGSRVRTLRFRTRIVKGRWRFATVLPSQARGGAHLSVVYPGNRARRIRGEQLTTSVHP
jgi:DNA-binding beta-propeller fold protein YncE